jgi:hypothetical protein
MFACECGKQLKTQEEQAGKDARCPACGRGIHIPGLPRLEIVPMEQEHFVSAGKNSTSLENLQLQTPDHGLYDEQAERVLLRLRGIHGAIAQAKARQNPFLVSLLLGFTCGIITLFLTAVPIVKFFGPSTTSPVPGLTMMAVFLAAFVITAWVDHRGRKAKALASVSRAEADLQIAVQEIQAQLPQWVTQIGGSAVLSDGRRLADEFHLLQHRRSVSAARSDLGLASLPRPVAVGTPMTGNAGDFKYRQPAAIFPLIAITAGIYLLVWIYKIHAELARRFAVDRTKSPGLALGLCFMPLFNLIWVVMLLYGVAKRANEVVQEQGLPPAVNSGAILTMLVVGQTANVASLAFWPLAVVCIALLWIATAQVQSALNQAWIAEGRIRS